MINQLKNISLLIVLLLACLFLPSIAHANGMLGIILAPFLMLFLLIISPLLAAFLKYLLWKLTFKERVNFPFKYLLLAMVAEASSMEFIILPAWNLMPRDIVWKIAEYLLLISDEKAIWYLREGLIKGNYLLSWFVVLLVVAVINFVLVSPLNLQLFKSEGQGFLKTISRPLNLIYAGLLGLIAPIILSLIILIPVSLKTSPHDSRYASLEGQQMLNKLLIEATSKGYTKFDKVLLDKGADINAMNRFHSRAVLHEAIKVPNNLDNIKKLINNGADVNLRISYGYTPLMTASESSKVDPELVQLLIQNGANVHARASRAQTSLMIASSNGKAKVARLLIENGADVNDTDDEGRTALWYAVRFHVNREILELLVHNGADLNAKDKECRTALMTAVEMMQTNKIEWLIALGANINSRDNNGKTALAICSRPHYTKVREFLINYGAIE